MKREIVEYEKVLHEVEKNIKRLEESGINVEDFKDRVNKLKASDKVADFSPEGYNYQKAYIRDTVGLEMLYKELESYEVAIKIASVSNLLKAFLEDEVLSKDEYDKIKSEIINLLNIIFESDVYVNNKELINAVYEIVYEIIKVGLIEYSDTSLFDFVKNNELHSFNVEKRVINELDRTNLREEENKHIFFIKTDIDNKGMNSSYLDKKLIYALGLKNYSKKSINRLVKDLIDKIDVKTDKKENDYINDLKGIKSYISNARRDLAKGSVRLTAGALIAAGLITGSIKLSKAAATYKKYETTKTYYSTLEDKVGITNDYSYEENEYSVTLNEYSTWEKNMWGKYVREVKKYDLSTLEEMGIKEYLDVDLESLGIKYEKETEHKETLTLADLYEEAYKEVIKLETGEFVGEETNAAEWFGFSFISILFSIILYTSYMLLMDSATNKDTSDRIEEIKDDINEIIRLKKEAKDCKRNLVKVKSELEEIYSRNSSEINRALELLDMIKDNPEYLEESNELRKVLENRKAL